MALCRIRVKSAQFIGSKTPLVSNLETIEQYIWYVSNVLFIVPDMAEYRSIDSVSSVTPRATIQQWIRCISNMFLTVPDVTKYRCIRDWDLILDLDGSVENIASDSVASPLLERHYPVNYRLPLVIRNQITNDTARIQREEQFALGTIIYELSSGGPLFDEVGPEATNIEQTSALIAAGLFPEKVWSLPEAFGILACWCPDFASEMLKSRLQGACTIP